MQKKALGKRGEAEAARYLKAQGYKIVERNYTSPLGEIDIVARDGEWVVFVEVKSRSDDQFGSPLEAVNQRKREKIGTTARHFLAGLRKQYPARFDVVSIYFRPGAPNPEIEHVRDAFEL